MPAVAQQHLDRLQLSAWALLRGSRRAAGTGSLASGGTLGGSQAGARLTYAISTRSIAASLRTSAPSRRRRGGEVAAGVRDQPLRRHPGLGHRRAAPGDRPFGSGRNAFALFAEGGVYQRPMPWNFDLDAYLQARRRRLQQPRLVRRRRRRRSPGRSGGSFSAGFGVWGGAQPGLYRLDAGPRVTMRSATTMRVHLDWRQRLAGNAAARLGPGGDARRRFLSRRTRRLGRGRLCG